MNKTRLLLTALGLMAIVILSLLATRSCQKEIELPWEVWEVLSQELKESPDHLPAKWKQILVDQDPPKTLCLCTGSYSNNSFLS